jgi:hypothetical protein
MLLENQKDRKPVARLLAILVFLTVVCAMAQSTPRASTLGDYRFHQGRPEEPALKIKWSAPTREGRRRIVELIQCAHGRCGAVKLDKLAISGTPGTEPQKMEVEVCHEVTPWKDRCDVYDCFEDTVGMMSVCNYLSSYNKSCYSETC